jgi:hypothetical protein
MSVEIESLSYHYQPPFPQDDSDPGPDDPPFRYNPLHDIESIWWVGVWFLFCHRETATKSDANLADAQAQLLHVQKLFPRVLMSYGRVEKFSHRHAFANGISSLPESFRQPARWLESGRRSLLGRFDQAEAGSQIDESAFEGVDDLFVKLFQEAKNDSGEAQLFSLNDFLRSSKEREDTSPPTSPTPSGPPKKKQRVIKK